MKKKVAVVGLGLTGSYLACRLAQETDFEIHGFERKFLHKRKDLCGWATRLKEFQEYVHKCDLPILANELILYKGKNALIQIGENILTITFPENFMGTINKTQFQSEMQSLAKEAGLKVYYGTGLYPTPSILKKYELFIDATGFQRSFIGKTTKKDCLIHCFQHTVKYDELPIPTFYFEMYPDGYLWSFPTGENHAHVGCGFLTLNPRRFIQQFIKIHPPEKILTSGNKPIRMLPPSACFPLTSRNTVAVGEAAGVIHPLIGEGIVPSLESADLLLDAMTDLDSCCQSYVESLLNIFKQNELEWKYFQARINRNKLASLWYGLRITMPMELNLTLRQKIQFFKAM